LIKVRQGDNLFMELPLEEINPAAASDSAT